MYKTQSGDTWDLIAKKVYGDELYLVHLMKANPAHLGTVVFPSSVALETPEATAPVKTDENLPPWKRGR